jgi:hypothetical protein
MLLRLKLEGFPRSSLRTVYQGLLVPHALYCISIWGGAGRGLTKTIQIQMNKGVRIMFGMSPWASTRDVMAAEKLPNVGQLYRMASAKFIFSNTACRGAHNLINLSLNRPSPAATNSDRMTRAQATRNLYVPAFNCEIRRRTVFVKGIKEFNELPATVRAPSSYASFKARLRKFVMSRAVN